MIPLIGADTNTWANFLQSQDSLLVDEDLSKYQYVVTLTDDKFCTDPRNPNPKYMQEHHLLRLLENALLTPEGWIDSARLAAARRITPDFHLLSVCNLTDSQGAAPNNKICMVAFVWNRIKFVYKREFISSSLKASPYQAR